MPPGSTRTRICVASTFSDRQPGGLTTVVKRLTAETVGTHDWTWLARLDRPGGGATDYSTVDAEGRRREPAFELRTVAPVRGSDRLLRRVGWTIFQPGGARVAPALYGPLVRPSVARQFPSRAEHLHWVGTGIELLGFELLRAARRAGIPVTAWPALHPGEWGDAGIDARLYGLVDGVLVLSGDERSRVEAMGVDPGRVTQVPLGPTVAAGGDAERFRRAYRVPAEVPVVAFMARRDRHKGLPATADAAARLVAAGTDLRLVIAGPPGDAPPVPEQPWLVDVGLADEATKADLLAAADVLCVPSTSEAFGIVYLDAWAAGLPVVTGRPPAVLELVDDGVDGLSVPQEVPAVAAALERLLGSAELRVRMGAAGRAKQREHYTWKRSAAVHLEAFARVGANRR